MDNEEEHDLMKWAHNAIKLCLSNEVLREVDEETMTAGLWTKLGTLYMTKSLMNQLYIPQLYKKVCPLNTILMNLKKYTSQFYLFYVE